MKKTLMIAIALLIVAAGFAGCAGKPTPDVEANKTETVESNVEETKGDTEEKAEEKTEKKAEEKTEEAAEEKSLVDKSLSGLALLQSVVMNPPKEFVMTIETRMGDRVSTSTTYTKEESYRMETEDPALGVKAIAIYNADEGATYQYNEGQTTGIVMLDGEDEEDTMAMDASFEMPSLKDLINSSDENISAKMDTLDGEEVVYIEATEADEEMGEVDVYMWYSVKYSTPLKYEIHMNDQLFLSMVVTNIDTKTKINDALLQKPEGVEFQEFSFDTMFGD